MDPGIATLNPPVDPARDHVRGPADAPVTLVEYGDFQCPYCGDAYPVVQHLAERFGDSLRFVFRHMPLDDLHPRAARGRARVRGGRRRRAASGRCTTGSSSTSSSSPTRTCSPTQTRSASTSTASRADLADPALARRVAEDFESGAGSGVPSTPRFFVNGVIHLGSASVPELREAIEAQLQLVSPGP